MATLIASGLGSTLSNGAGLVESSGGNKVAILRYTSLLVAAYESIDTSPSLVGSTQSATTIFGSSFGIGGVAAAIDSTNVVHVIMSCAVASPGTRVLAYNTISNVDSSPAWGTWETVGGMTDWTNYAPNEQRLAISIDSNDKPHVVFSDGITSKGASADQIMYTEKTGASWATPTQLSARADKTDEYRTADITLKSSDNIEVVYNHSAGATTATLQDLVYRTWNGSSWSTEASYAESAPTRPIGVAVTSGGTVYRYHATSSATIRENGTSIGYTPSVLAQHAMGMALDGTNRYVFYIDSGSDIHLVSNTGSGWTDEGDLQVGTYTNLIVEWAYNNENQTNEINYLFETGDSIYWDSFSTATGTLFTQSAAGSLTPSGVVSTIPHKVLAGAIAAAGVITKRSIFKTLVGTVSSAGNAAKKTWESLVGSLTPTGDVATQSRFTRLLEGTVSSAGDLARKTLKLLAGSETPSGDVTKKTSRALAGAVSSAGDILKKSFKLLTGTAGSSGTVDTQSRFTKALAGVVSSAGTVVKKTMKTLAGDQTSSGTISKKMFEALAGVVSSSGIADGVKSAVTYFQSVSGSITPTGDVTKLTRKTFAGAVSSAGDLAKKTLKTLTGLASSAGTIVKKTSTTLLGSLTPTGIANGVKQVPGIFYQSVGGVVGSSGELGRSIFKSFAGSLTPAGAVAKKTWQSFVGSLTPTGTIVKKMFVGIAGIINPSGELARLVRKMLAGDVASAGDISRLIRKSFTGVVSSAGSMVKKMFVALSGNATIIGIAAAVKNPLSSVIAIGLTWRERDFVKTLKDRAFTFIFKSRE